MIARSTFFILILQMALGNQDFAALDNPKESYSVDEIRQYFNKFLDKFNKSYDNQDEHERRFGVFADTFKKIVEHNRSGSSFKMGINQFSDLTEDEFKNTYLMKPSWLNGSRGHHNTSFS